MDQYKLRQELQSDSYTDLSDSEAAEKLNEKTFDKYIPLTTRQLLEFVAQNGRAARILALTQSDDQNLKSIAVAAQTLVEREEAELDFNSPVHVELIDALVSAGALSTDDKTELIELATTKISKAEQLGLPKISARHVANVREN
ncbi:MAG: hypothetical protein CL946_06310 [Ectothiorhodospiraceae bacterium]|nr:hypothetical protein [Ectothiorhodospiraceae bacterium]